jgi:cyclophilin family peptidyl-prolyl cis-trans isomerase
MKYYNGCLFHKVEKDFLAQTGDPTGTVTGGDSVYKLSDFFDLNFLKCLQSFISEPYNAVSYI